MRMRSHAWREIVHRMLGFQSEKACAHAGGCGKERRARGGCLGDGRRGRAWTAATSSGEPLTGCEPEVPEWENPAVGRPAVIAR
jgi:hypothetical protein